MSGVEIRVRSDSRQARRDLSQLENSVKNIETRTARATSAFRKMAIGIGAALAGGAVIKGVNRASDSLVNLENRIALVTGRGKALDKTMNDLFRIAKRTRGDIGGSAETFNRFGIALKDSGKSAEEILRAVESVNKAVAISGSGAESARAALFQLGQGLASGQLRGQELNSVLEQTPRLAGAIADELGKPLGALRKLAEQGEVTTEVVFNALINQADKLSAEFETMEGTSEQAFSVMKDQIGRVVGEISAGLNITGSFTQKLNAISDSLEKNRTSIVSNVVGSVQSIGKIFRGVIDTIKGIVAVLGTAVLYVKDLVNFGNKIDINFAKPEILERASESMGSIVALLKGAKTDTRFVTKAMDRMGKSITKAFDSIKDFKSDTFERIANLSKLASENIKELYKEGKKFAALKYIQLRGGEGLIQDYITYLKIIKAQRQAEKSARQLFKNISEFASKYLSQAWKSIKTFLNLIERKFFWVYDKVIGNSWWTDTMEQTYYLAREWLGKASDAVSRFGDTVTEKFRGVFESFKNGTSAFRSNFTIDDVKIKFGDMSSKFKDLASKASEALGSALRSSFEFLGTLSPVISASFGAALVAGVTKFLSPELFKKTFGKIGPAAFVLLFAGIASNFSKSIVDSGIFNQLGANLGTTLAIGFDAFLDLIPSAVDAIIQTLSSIGTAFGKQLEGSILGLPAKILSFIPGGGLITTMFYGAVGLSAFSKTFRTFMKKLIVSTIASSQALTSAQGVAGNILFGKLGARKGLGVLAVTTTASIALFGDLIGAELASVIGILSGIMATSFLSGQGALTALGATFSGVRALITRGSVLIYTAGASAFKKLSISGITSLRALQVQNTITTTTMTAQWIKFGRSALSATTGFLGTAKGKFIGIAGGALLASAAMTTFANASESAGDGVSGGLFTAENLFSTLTVASLVSMLWKPLKPAVKVIGKRLGLGIAFGALRAIGLALIAGVSAVFTPFAAAFAAVAATATLGYIAIFGTEGSFLSMVTKTLTKVKRQFGLTFDNDLRVGIDTKREARGLRNRTTGGLDKAVVDRLQRIDFGGLSQKSAFAITDSVKTVSNLTEKANAERLRFGKVSAQTAQELKAAQEETTRAVREGAKDVPDNAKDVSIGLERITRNLSVGISSTGFFSNLSADFKILTETVGNRFKVAFGGQATDLQRRLDFSTAVKEADLNDPKQFKAIISQLFTTEGGFQSSAVPMSMQQDSVLIDALNDVALGVEEPSEQLTQAFLRAINEGRKQDRDLIGSILRVTGVLEKLGITSLTASQKAIQNLTTSIGDEGRQQLILANIREVDNVVSALSRAGEGIADKFAFINQSETKIISDLVERQKVEEQLLEQSKSERFQAESEEEINAAIAKGESARKELGIISLELERQVRDSIKTGIEATSFTYITDQLDALGIDTRLAELIAKGITTGTEDFRGFDKNIFGKGLETLNFGAMIGNRQGGATTSLKPEEINKAILELVREKKILEEIERAEGTLDEAARQRYFNTKDNISKLTKEIELYVSFLDSVDITDAELPNLLASVANMSQIENIDLDKFFRIEPDTQKQVALMASQIELLKNTSPGDLVSLGLGDFGNDVGGRDKLISMLQSAIDDVLGNFGDSIRTGFLSDFEEIQQETGLTFNEIASLGVGANTKIRKSIDDISKAQKALNKLSVDNTVERAEQLRLIKEAEDAINRQLMAGTINSARAGLERQGVNPDLINDSREALSIGMNIASLERELGRLRVDEIDERDDILEKIKQQERLLNGITEKAQSSADSVRDAFKGSTTSFLTGEISSLEDAFKPFLDSLSMDIIDTVVDSFTDALFQTAGLDNMFEDLFSGLFKTGDKSGEEAGGFLSGLFSGKKKDKSVEDGSKKAAEPFGGVFNEFLGGLGDKFGTITDSFGGIFNGLTGSLGGIFEGLGGTFSGLFSSLGGLFGGAGGGGGGGDLLGTALKLGSSFFGFPGFSQGGVVPSTPFSQVGKDSVPAMLMPGEVVMSKNAVRNSGNNQSSQQSTFNINVQGDVSRQTRKEIVKMMPQIAGGVNSQNKENNKR